MKFRTVRQKATVSLFETVKLWSLYSNVPDRRWKWQNCVYFIMMFVISRNECMDMHKNWFPNAEGHCNSVPRHRECVCCVVVVLFTTFKPLRCGLLLPRPLYVTINYFWGNSYMHNGWIEVLNITKIVDKPFLDAGTPIQCIYDNHVLTTWIYYVQNST